MKKIREIFEDVNGTLSSKRVIGISGVITCLSLLVYAVIGAVNSGNWPSAQSMIEFGLMTFAGLLFGGSAVEFMSKGKKDETDNKKS